MKGRIILDVGVQSVGSTRRRVRAYADWLHVNWSAFGVCQKPWKLKQSCGEDRARHSGDDDDDDDDGNVEEYR